MRGTGQAQVQVEGIERVAVRFAGGGDECAAWHYPSANGACVIMAGGFAVTKEPGTDLFARRFHDAGFGVLAFDYRRIGESGGRPRQVLPLRDQLADWHAAIAFAGTLPGVDPARIALWGFSASGGHVLRVAAQGAPVAAVIAQTPNADGPAASRNAARHQKPGAALRFAGLVLADILGGLVGRAPILVPLDAPPGTVALLTTPDAQDSGRALNPGNRYPQWRQVVAARSTAGLMFYRPGRDAARVPCPLLVVACEQDQAALYAPGVKAAERAPRGELVTLPGGHYAPFLDEHEAAVDAEVSFLTRHLTPGGGAGAPGAGPWRAGVAGTGGRERAQ
ncbi:MAG: alpha/beta hydrolase [Actinocrinis sp.]